MNTSLQLYFSEQTLQIPKEFKDQFIYNYEHQNEWIASDKLYDWFGHIHYNRYQTFVREIERQLLEGVEYSVHHQGVIPQSTEKGGRPKKILLVSQSGIKQMAMLSDKQTRRYYAQLEDVVINYVKFQECQTKQLHEETRLQLEEEKKKHEETKQNEINLINSQPASIYQIKNKNGQTIYVGKDKSANQSRVPTHLLERQKILSNYQYIDIVLATMLLDDIVIETTPCLQTEADDKEKALIQELNPMCNQMLNSECVLQCKKCQKEYKSRGWLNRHEIRGCD